ncbi:MAG: hypothetical protein IIY78_02305 [Clostridia bacterium]|nr:hypothetical protein [Clostridia bacterium]
MCQNENYRSITPPSRLLSQPSGTVPNRRKAVEGFYNKSKLHNITPPSRLRRATVSTAVSVGAVAFGNVCHWQTAPYRGGFTDFNVLKKCIVET